MVATNAFGMGIDRPDVRAVVHLAPPGSIEAYYQEVGRAGRDGAIAYGLMLVAPNDLPLRRRLIEGDTTDAAVVAHKWGLFLELMRWAEGGSCRHDAILRYFGDEAETLDGCGHCDVCETLQDDPVDRRGDDADRAQGAERGGAREQPVRPEGRRAPAARRGRSAPRGRAPGPDARRSACCASTPRNG